MTGELRRGSDIRRLEPRAAKTLGLLWEADGEIVTHDQLIAGIWGGRSLSDNSVAVVIGQLRRALEDDAREPHLIETIPKRGYRLVRSTEAAQGSAKRPFVLLLGALLFAVALAFLWPSSGQIEVALDDVVNETGSRSYDPLTRATSELMVAKLNERGFDVRRDGRGDVRLSATLVMWNGEPYLGLTATDPDGVLRWSAMIKGTAAQIPAGVSAKLDEFRQFISER